MRIRVSCVRCRAHRDRALPNTEWCLVCGASAYELVPLNAHDLERAILDAEQNLDRLRALKATQELLA